MAKERAPRIVDHVSDSSDEEIDEDDAFNSEDERMYGSSFNKNQGGDSADNEDEDDSSEASYDEDSDGIASDDDEVDGDGGEYMLNLLNNLDKNDDQEKNAKNATRKTLAHSTLVAESEFSSLHKTSNLTMDQLMSGISDTKGFKDVQKTMKDMTGDEYDKESRLKTTRAPVAKVVSNRLERKVQYQEQSEEVSLWTKVVKQNREAETLDFRPKDRIRITKDELVGKFEPSTDFEREMAAALEEAGAAEEKDIKENEGRDLFGEEDEDDDLGRNDLSAEDFKKRHGELAKMRALMFYEEQKRHHMNKIKSKKYRKIRKKQKLRMKDAEDAEAAENDDDYAKDLEEKAEVERMKERMSLKHRNTSKWAKSVLRRGKSVDLETRRALSEQVRVGNELKRKMEGQYDADSDDDNDDDEALLKQARDILADAANDSGVEERKGLFKLDFMKKGLEAQRERAKQEARELLRELEANTNPYESGLEESNSDEDKEESVKKTTIPPKEMDKILTKGKMVASSLEFGNSNPVSVAGGINLEIDSMPKSTNATTDIATNVRLSNNMKDEKVGTSKPLTKITTPVIETNSKERKDEQNPWVNQGNTLSKDKLGPSKKKDLRQAGVSKKGIINVINAVNVITGDDEINHKDRDTKVREVFPETNSKISLLSQDELVKKAFATLSEQDIDEDFQKEKNTLMDREDYSKKEKDDKKLVTGWGSWAGEGAPPPNPLRKLPKKLAIPEKKIEKRPRQDDGKKNVIISAKRIKKAAKFQVENVPYPFTSREQYERAINGAVGPEWNISTAVKNFTRPDVVTRAGKMIRPISKKAKMKRAPLVKFK